MNKMKISLAVGLPLLFSPLANADNFITDSVDDDIVVAGDIIQVALPLTGLFAAWVHDDPEGAKQQAYTLGSTIAIVQTGKFAVGRTRPNKSNTASYPSGHTAAAVSGASFLYNRYGPAWGLPAYAAATFVGASRVHGNRHFADDVLAGGGIAFLNSRYWVSEFERDGVNVMAVPKDDGVMLTVQIENQAFDYNKPKKKTVLARDYRYKHSFTLNLGADLHDSMGDIDSNPSFENSEPLDPNQPFSSALYEYMIDKDSSIEVALNPNETRREGTIVGTLVLDDHTYNDGEEFIASLRQWGFGANYMKHWRLEDNLKVAAGAGLFGYHIQLQSELIEGGKYESIRDNLLLPSVAAKAQYFFAPQWSVTSRMDLQYLDDHSFYAEAGVHYHVTPSWQVGAQYGYQHSNWRDIKLSYDAHVAMISITNRF
ncbi:phosphatase PAP2 family protein [Vibrio hannami]|uniref:phosphatase PAP2 family protein n=1 Tax=Vibrio hannami TaxID=2717094 RepID=UPI00241082EC|nr:phosphatase PAP2 family protein [Vibrio hannami]MDG3086497.1 phosphatase PAP2 family protein [Vibrio hannami]